MNDLFSREMLNRFAKYLLIGVSVLLVFFFILAFLRVGLVYWLWSTVDTWVTVRLGLDYYAAQLLTMIVVSFFIAVLPTIAWYFLLGKRKWQGTAFMIGGQALVFILVYTIGANVCFDRRTGESLCWYADTPDGRYFSTTDGFHPKYGIELTPYTRQVALGLESTEPSNTSTPRATKRTSAINVISTNVWTNSGLKVAQGQRMSVTASGITTTAPNKSPDTGPDGDNNPCIASTCLMQGLAYATLIAKIGDGKPFRVGSRLDMTANTSGDLFFTINDNDFGFADNKGTYLVEIELR